MTKHILFLGMIVLCSTMVHAQETTTTDSTFIVTYTVGSLWDNAKAFHEQPYFEEHSAFLGKMRKDGVAKFGARYADKGIIIFTAASLTAAKEFIYSDPSVINKLFQPDVQRLSIFYEGCVTRAPKK